MTYSFGKTLFLTTCIAGVVLCAIPTRAALSDRTVSNPPQSAEPSTTNQAGQGYTTIVVDPDAGVELHLTLLMTDPMVEVSTQHACRVATVLAYFTVGDDVQYSLDLQAHVVDLTGTESLGANADYTADGKEYSYSIQMTPKNSVAWGKVTGLGDLAIQATPF